MIRETIIALGVGGLAGFGGYDMGKAAQTKECKAVLHADAPGYPSLAQILEKNGFNAAYLEGLLCEGRTPAAE